MPHLDSHTLKTYTTKFSIIMLLLEANLTCCLMLDVVQGTPHVICLSPSTGQSDRILEFR